MAPARVGGAGRPTGGEAFLTVRDHDRGRGSAWAPAGFEVCAVQLPVGTATAAPCRAPPRRTPPAPCRSTRTAGSSIRCWRRRRPCRSGAPRPTTTGSAGWPARWAELGRRPARAATRRHRARRAPRPSCAPSSRPAAGIVVPHEAAYTRLADGGIAVEETVDIPDDLADLAARRDRARGRARSGGPALVRLRAARDVPGSQARRAGRPLGVDRRRPVRPVHPAAGERRPRRRPLARADRCAAAPASGSSSTSPARCR